MDLDTLRCVERAATTLNFRAAAGQSHLSPAAFSERIQALERELGALLFERSTRSVRLTPAGARALPAVRACLAAEDALRDAISAGRDAYALTIGTRAELGMSWLTPALPALEAAAPHRALHLWVSDSPGLAEAVRAGRVDAIVSSQRIADESLVAEPLHEERYAFVAAPAALAGRPLTGPADAPAHTLFDISADLPLFRYLLDAAGGPVWPFGRRTFLGGIGAVRVAVLAGRGVAVLPRYCIEDALADGTLTTLTPALPLGADWFRLIWRSGHPRATALRALAAELRALPLR